MPIEFQYIRQWCNTFLAHVWQSAIKSTVSSIDGFGSYSTHLNAKLSELCNLFKMRSETLPRPMQKEQYNFHSAEERPLHKGDPVWLSVPTAGKLNPWWEGGWIIQAVKSPVTVKISDGQRTKVVHVNRLRYRWIPQQSDSGEETSISNSTTTTWQPPQIDQLILPPAPPTPPQRYPQRDRRPPDRYTYWSLRTSFEEGEACVVTIVIDSDYYDY